MIKISVITALNWESIKILFKPGTKSGLQKLHYFTKASSGAGRGQQRLAPTWKRPVFVLARPKLDSEQPKLCRSRRRSADPLIQPLNFRSKYWFCSQSIDFAVKTQMLSHWFCSQTLRLFSGIVSGTWIDCQMNSRGSKLNSNLSSAAWKTSCKSFISSKIPDSLGPWLNCV